MKKVGLIVLVVGLVAVLSGCQTKSSSGTTDEADSALVKGGAAQSVNTPPVPPEPTRPAK